MIDKRVGKRIKQRREQLGLTQEQFAEKLGVATNYISTIERGASFPRYEKLVAIINALETSADAIFCDVVTHSLEYKSYMLLDKMRDLPPEEQNRGVWTLLAKETMFSLYPSLYWKATSAMASSFCPAM